jgi:hypothetical protein
MITIFSIFTGSLQKSVIFLKTNAMIIFLRIHGCNLNQKSTNLPPIVSAKNISRIITLDPAITKKSWQRVSVASFDDGVGKVVELAFGSGRLPTGNAILRRLVNKKMKLSIRMMTE